MKNSIYHGLKLKRSKGLLIVTVHNDENSLLIKVEDDGIGIKSEKLNQIRANLQSSVESKHYGLYNVNERLKLAFKEEYFITIESQIDSGTAVSIRLKN